MTLKFIDGFDHYTTAQALRKWSSTSFGGINTPGRFGGGYLLVDANGRYWLKNLPAQTTWVIGAAVKHVNFANNVSLFSLQSSGTAQCDLRSNIDGTLSVTRNGTALTGGTSTLALVNNAWHYIEWKVTIADSIAASSCKVRVNGVDWITVATGQDLQNAGVNTANQFVIGMIGSGSTVLNFDDFYICDQSGSVNNDFLGDVRVETLYPVSAGINSQWAPSAGANYACVDDATANDDTDYVASSTANQVDTYTLGNLSSNPTSIRGIQTVFQHRKDDAGSRTVAPVVRSGGTDYAGTAVSVPDSYIGSTEIRETDPATSAAWTAAGINALEAGIKLVS